MYIRHQNYIYNTQFMKFFTPLFFFLLFTTISFSQEHTVRGFLYEKKNGEPVLFEKVMLLNPKDSSIYAGAMTDVNGFFTIPKVQIGKYIVKVENPNFVTIIENIEIKFANTPEKKNIYYKFYYYYYLNLIFGKKIKTPYCDQKIELLKLVPNNGSLQRTIIYENNTLSEIFLDLKIKYKSSYLFDINELLMRNKYPILDIYYYNNGTKISIIDILNKYADKNKNFKHNTLKNIFALENININNNNNNNNLYIYFFKFIKKHENIIDFENLINAHVSDIYNLE